MFHSRKVRVAGLALGCATIGAAAGIAGSAASPSSSAKPAPRVGPLARLFGAGGPAVARVPRPALALGLGGMFGPGRLGGPPVHATEVVPNPSGSGFQTVTFDRGTVKSVSGQNLTITEGTQKAVYGTPTISIPANAKVWRNGASASLSSLKQGDQVIVMQSPQGTTVAAIAAAAPAGVAGPRPAIPGALSGATLTRGTVGSVSGQQLAVEKAGGGTATLTIPSGASIRRNGSSSSLSSLQKGDEVFVVQTSSMTAVIAFAPGSGPRFGAHGMRGGFFAPPAGGPPGPGPGWFGGRERRGGAWPGGGPPNGGP